MTKFAIDPGHNCAYDGGAAGVSKSENQLIMEVSKKVIKKLKALGHTVVDCRPRNARSFGDSLRRRSRKANRQNCDVFVSIHFNAFNGNAHGCEVLYISQAGRTSTKRNIKAWIPRQRIKVQGRPSCSSSNHYASNFS